MIRLFIFLAFLCLAGLGLYAVLANPLPVRFEVLGYQGQTNIAFFALGLIVISLVLTLLWRLLDFLFRLPSKIKRSRALARFQKGFSLLESAMISEAEGDHDKARKQALEAEDYLGEQSFMARLIEARMSVKSGDFDSAQRRYHSFSHDKKTSMLSRRGLSKLALIRGDGTDAEFYAKEALEDNPKTKWAFDTLFDLSVRSCQWNKALELLKTGEKRGHFSSEEAGRYRTVLLTAFAAEAEMKGDQQTALQNVEKASGSAPGFAPAAALAARLLTAQGKTWKAANLLETAWTERPHPALALAYRDLKEQETIKDRAERMMGLAEMHADHRESRLLMAEQALALGDAEKAYKALLPLLDEHQDTGQLSARFCTLMALIAKRKGDVVEAESWNQRAIKAHFEPDWSDLDPEGPAFAYLKEDWARLVFSYGESGELIHPRHERFERMYSPTPSFLQNEEKGQKEKKVSEQKDSEDLSSETSSLSSPHEKGRGTTQEEQEASSPVFIDSSHPPDDPGMEERRDDPIFGAKKQKAG